MRSSQMAMWMAAWSALVACGCSGSATKLGADADGGDAAEGSEDAGAADAQTSPNDAQVDAEIEPIDPQALAQDPNWAWVSLPAGRFEMGGGNLSPPGNVQIEFFLADGPRHTVDVAEFQVLRTEVTVAQYRLCVRAGACSAPNTSLLTCTASSGENNWLLAGHDAHPVNCVSPAEGARFCAWAGGRLPSEAEWEYAARSGGQAKHYAWGDSLPDCGLGVFRVPASCGSKPSTCTCGGQSQPVCSKPAGNTAQGLCDMVGNVYEPVADAFHQNYEGAPIDGSAWGAFTDHGVLRSGSFASHDPDLLRVTARAEHRASPLSQFGVRCVR